MNINIKFDPEGDKEIIAFLKEKKANTFIIREALKLYIAAYKGMGQGEQVTQHQQAQPERPVVASSALDRFKRGGNINQ